MDSSKELRTVLENNYLSASAYVNSGEKKNEEAVDKICRDFVLHWFSTHKQVNGRDMPDAEQAMAIGSLHKSTEVVARAGSGKTTTIIGRANFLINHCGVDPDEILMLAFNRKAMQEMQKRMEDILRDSSNGLPHIKTFHSLAYAVANRKDESKRPLIFDNDEGAEFDSKDISKALSQVIQQIVQQMIRENGNYAHSFRELMTSYFRGVWQTIETGGYNLPKEDQLTLRRSLETKTLNDEEVSSIKEKIAADILFEHDIDYFIKGRDIVIPIEGNKRLIIRCINEQKNKEYYDWYLREKRTLLLGPEAYLKGEKHIERLIEEALKNENKTFTKLSELEIWRKIQYRAIDEYTKAVTNFVGRCRKKDLSLIDLDGMIKRHEPIVQVEMQFLELAREIYAQYVKYLDDNGMEDFDGLVKRASEMISNGQVFFDKTGDFRNIKHIMIDEYQDFSYLFDTFISSIRSICPDSTMFCVGDDWQAINAFAGSDTSFFNYFCNNYEDARRYYLTTNYRSVPEIVNIGNELMESWSNGITIKPFRTTKGVATIGYPEKFQISVEENDMKADNSTLAIIRLVRWVLDRDENIVLLFRTKSQIENGYLKYIRSFFSYEEAKRIEAYTTHKYKGKQEDAVIIVDAIERKYPLIHPTWFFMRIFDDEYRKRVLKEVSIDIVGDVTLRKIVGDEKRLFYVALSRAKNHLFILTKGKEESRFLTNSIMEMVPELRWDDYNPTTGTHDVITVEVKNNAERPTTIYIKNELHAEGYHFNSHDKFWYKKIRCKVSEASQVFQEKWVKKAHHVFVDIKNNKGVTVAEYFISQGRPNKIR